MSETVDSGRVHMRAPRAVASAGELAATLACSPLFRSLDPSALHSVEGELTHILLRGGETLFAAGDAGDCLYVVICGRLRAQRTSASGLVHVLGEIGRGESVGELAVLTGGSRMATVCAIRDTELIRLSRASFEVLMARQPQVTLELTRQIITRYQQSLRSVSEARPVTLALLPTGPDVPIRQFAAELVRALSPGRRVLHLDADRLAAEAAMLGGDPENLDQRALAAWLHDQELLHDYVVYAAEPSASAWTHRCLRQADRALIVGGSGGLGQLDPALWQLLDSKSENTALLRRELVLLYDGGSSEPAGTADWLKRFDVQGHYHVDRHAPRDFERLARSLTGSATGLVLGGGGARGLAHLGVLRALEEAGLAIDLVGGTSIGAIIGAQLACGWDSRRMVAESRRALVERGSLHDYTLPVMSLVQGRRYLRMLESLFGERRIEDLPLPYYCTSTNLTRGEGVVHRTGPLRKWVAASAAVPGLSPPIFDSREILVDGGVRNNLPVDVMRGLTSGPVFAVNVSPDAEMRLDREYPDMMSPWRVLLSRLNPFGTAIRVPTLASILVRTATLPPSRAQAGAEWTPDLIFQPPTSAFKLLDWRAFDQLVEIGYRSALETLEHRDRGTGDCTRTARGE